MPRLYVAKGWWVVDYHGDSQEADIRRLFDGAVLPTAFRATTPRSEVVARLAQCGTTVI